MGALLRLMAVAMALVHVVTGQKVGVSSTLGFGCWNCASTLDFGCGQDLLSSCRCNSTAFLGTVLSCINTYAHGQEDIIWGCEYVARYCEYNGGIIYTLKELDAISAATQKDLYDPTREGKSGVLTSPVRTSYSAFKAEYKAASTAKHQYALGTIFGVILLGYWGLIITGAFAHQILTSRFFAQYERMATPALTKFRKYVTLPAVFGGPHCTPYRPFRILYIQAPTRGQSIILTGYLILNLLSILLLYRLYSPNPFIESKKEQLLRYLGNRTGIVAFTQMPLLVLFAGRNSVLRYITGWSYQTLHVYHRWISRAASLHAIIHAVCFTWLAISQETVKIRWTKVRNWQFGNASMFAMLLMLLIASNYVKLRYYEWFSASHRVLFIVFLVAIYYHCVDFGWMHWVYLTIALYAFEMVCRLFRTLRCGAILKASLVVCDESTYRISVTVPKRLQILPGSYVYLRVLQLNSFWQSHPFTIIQSSDKTSQIEILVKRRSGMTNKLARSLQESENQELSIRVMVEGFYHSGIDLKRYDTAVMLAGGVGISPIYAQAMALASRPENSTKMIIIWVVRDWKPMAWFEDDIRQLLLLCPRIDLQMFVTSRSMGRNGTDPENMASLEESNDAQYRHITDERGQEIKQLVVHDSKPDLRSVLSQYLQHSAKSVAVMSCGPPSFVDDSRDAVVHEITESPSAYVDYFEESFAC